ncbi:unnamed protein product, partial [Owenia fusiformis]
HVLLYLYSLNKLDLRGKMDFNYLLYSMLLCSMCCGLTFGQGSVPIVLATWGFAQQPTDKAWEKLQANKGPLDAVQSGCEYCEFNHCASSVGYANNFDENGETTLDAMLMEGKTHKVGGVAAIKRVVNAIGVARAVMDYTTHTLLTGESATSFAREMGFPVLEKTTLTNATLFQYLRWRYRDCQPNNRKNVKNKCLCGPYSPLDSVEEHSPNELTTWKDLILLKKLAGDASMENLDDHDTLGVLAIDAKGDIAAGVTTNGMRRKVPGRVGDSPIPGSGAYVDNDIGGAVCTGDGDIMMRFLPSYHAVQMLQFGLTPTQAGHDAMLRILKVYPFFSGACIVVNKQGEHGAGCTMARFPMYVRTSNMDSATLLRVNCTIPETPYFNIK